MTDDEIARAALAEGAAKGNSAYETALELIGAVRADERERCVQIAESCYEKEPHSDTVFGINIGIERVITRIKNQNEAESNE